MYLCGDFSIYEVGSETTKISIKIIHLLNYNNPPPQL